MKVKSPLGPGTPLHAGSNELFDCFELPACRAYVDTASYGLPPRATVRALQAALEAWRLGTANWIRDWDQAGEECRGLAARLLGAPESEIALLPAVSTGAAVVAASLGSQDEVVVPDDEFRSLLLPLLVAERSRGTRVRRVPFDAVADAVGPSTTVVATSHVRSNGGGVQDLDAVAEAAARCGARLVVDATHSAGILPVEAERRGLDVVICSAYKHLLSPRGVAFMRVARGCFDALEPFCASWRSTADPYLTYYGGTLADLAPTAARFDVSLAWHSWIGARESLALLDAVPADERAAWPVSLAKRLAELLEIEPTGSSIVGVPVTEDAVKVRSRLEAAGVVASIPLGQVRVSFHLYNRPEDVDYVASILGPLVGRQGA